MDFYAGYVVGCVTTFFISRWMYVNHFRGKDRIRVRQIQELEARIVHQNHMLTSIRNR